MFIINKITQLYDRVEDRIRIDIENPEGEAISLWMTQLMTNSLAATLIKKFEDVSKEKVKGQLTSGIQSIEQSIAQASFKPTQPVKAVRVKEVFLVHAISMKVTETGYLLSFRWGESGEASLGIKSVQTRQWLTIIHRLTKTAGWNQEVWPAWLLEDDLIYKNTQTGPVH